MSDRIIPPELLEAALAGYDVVIAACRPVAWESHPPPGLADKFTRRPPHSEVRPCQTCGTTVHATRRQIKAAEKVPTKFLCWPCAFRETRGMDVDSIPMYCSFDEVRDDG